MKQIFLLLALSFYISLAAAQGLGGGGASGVTGRISGVVIDSLTKEPLEYATISLYRSGGKVPLNGVVTDAKGAFKLNNINSGNYKITVSYIGYPTLTFDTVKTTPEKPDNNMGTIRLSVGANALKEVVVQGQAAVIENKIDKIVYNAERDITSAGGNATDLLRKVPLLSVDLDGNVSLRGSQNVRVLINGKPSGAMSNNLADVLKSIPADQIKNVEVITSPSAKYDAEGAAGIINIITKKKDIQGVSGSVSAGMGTRQNNGNANLNIKQNRLSLTGNLGSNFSWPQTSLTSFTLKNSATGNIINSQNGTSEAQRLAYIASGNLGYDFNNFNSISSSIRSNNVRFTTDGGSEGFENAMGSITNFSSATNNKNKFGGFDWNNDFTHKFKKEGHELSIAGQWSRGKSQTDYTSLNVGRGQNEIGNNDGVNDEFTVQTDYTLPVKKLTIETGLKGIYRNITSDYDIQNQTAGVFATNPLRSNVFDYSQDVLSAYGVLGASLKNSWSIKVGGRVELTDIEGSSQNVNAGLQPISQNYTNFVPSFILSKGFKNFQTVKLSYSKRIQRPSLQFLNPFRNISSVYSQTVGNPGLSPEISQTLELGYSTFVKTTVINASVYYKRTDDIIESFSTPIEYTYTDDDGQEKTVTANQTSFANIGKNNSIGASLFGSVNPIKILTLRGNINAYTYGVSPDNQFNANVSQSNETYLLYNAFLSASVKLKGGISAETFFILNAPRRTFQGQNPAFNMWVLGAKKEILKKKGSIGFNVIDPFNERKNFKTNINNGTLVQSSNFALPFRSFGVNFTWNFGKLNFNAQPKKKRGVNNDDLKQGDGGGQGQGGTGGN